MLPTSLDVIIVPDVVGNVITLPLDVVIVETFTVTAEMDPLLTIELPVIVPNTVTLENTFDISGTPLA
jgi:hypothetical protein